MMGVCEGKTFAFCKASIVECGSVVGKVEGEGPYGMCFDEIVPDNKANACTWEQAESIFQKKSLEIAMKKAKLTPDKMDLLVGGDLLNQCTGSAYGVKDFYIPFLGIYGACSTFAEGLIICSGLVNAGYVDFAGAVTSSHFSSAERQFRFPLNYGGVRTPTAQWTATAAAATIISSSQSAPFIRKATIGKIQDMGISDLNNMGAAMAGAAYDTISRHLKHTASSPEDYDVIVTGDLGEVGSAMLYQLFERDGVDLKPHHNDCGLMLYDRNSQDVHAGGSGCGCSAAMMCGHFLPKVKSGEFKRILYVATGALMSPTLIQQGNSIAGIAHAVEICAN